MDVVTTLKRRLIPAGLYQTSHFENPRTKFSLFYFVLTVLFVSAGYKHICFVQFSVKSSAEKVMLRDSVLIFNTMIFLVKFNYIEK